MKVALDENYIGSLTTLVNYLNKSAKQMYYQLTLYHSWGIKEMLHQDGFFSRFA